MRRKSKRDSRLFAWLGWVGWVGWLVYWLVGCLLACLIAWVSPPPPPFLPLYGVGARWGNVVVVVVVVVVAGNMFLNYQQTLAAESFKSLSLYAQAF